MADELVLTKTRLSGGVWEGVLTGAGPDEPVLTLRHQGEALPGLTLSALENEIVAAGVKGGPQKPMVWAVNRVPYPLV